MITAPDDLADPTNAGVLSKWRGTEKEKEGGKSVGKSHAWERKP